MAAKTISLADLKTAPNLHTIFAKIKNIYFSKSEISAAVLNTGVDCDLELPVLSDGVNFNTGDADVTQTKLTTGAIWASRADRGDSDISFQVASLDGQINSLFLTKKANASLTGIKFSTNLGIAGQFNGESYSLDVNKVTGSLVMTDDTKDTIVILTNVEMYGALVVADGDNPAYFNVTVTPLDNAEGAALILLERDTTTKYTITVTGEHGTVTGAGSYFYGEVATLTATPAEGYVFTKWSDDDTNAVRDVVVTENKTYTATFTAQ